MQNENHGEVESNSGRFPASRWIEQVTAEPNVIRLRTLEAALSAELPTCFPPGSLAGLNHLQIKRQLSRLGFTNADVPRRPSVADPAARHQALIQFVLGYPDLDLRDAAGIGHGRMIPRWASNSDVADDWVKRLKDGALVGIAATEPGGGTAKHRFKTRAVFRDGKWTLHGEKLHISRINEAQAFVVFCHVPGKGLSAVLIPATAPGIVRENFTPTGLQGWSWGGLKFNKVAFSDADFLGLPGEGHAVFEDHFIWYRPLVAATALGAAAAIYDLVEADLKNRKVNGQIKRYRDTTLEQMARSRYEITANLLAVLNPHLHPRDGRSYEEWALCAKAIGVETALDVVLRLRLLMGARSVYFGGKVDKVIRDLQAYQYADGINSELLRGAGKRILAVGPKP